MKKVVDAWINSILLLITLPPRPQPRPLDTSTGQSKEELIDEQIPDLVPSCKSSPANAEDKQDGTDERPTEEVPERLPAEPEKPPESDKPPELEKPPESDKPAELEKPAEEGEDKKEEEFRVDKVVGNDDAQDVPELKGRPKQRG